jgi:hypothetical protein
MLALFVIWTLAPSQIIFPPQSTAINFSHARHIRASIACDFCHERAPSSTKSSDNLVPAVDVCETCHPPDRAHPEKSKGADLARIVIPPPNLKFDHSVHVKKGITCLRCHSGVERVDVATRAQLPSMPLCLSCHDSKKDKAGLHGPSRCATCHLTHPDGTLVQEFAEGALKPSGALRGDAHTLGFRTEHASVAANDDRYCANCHRQNFCLSCHNGVVKPLDFHGNDYVSIHAIEARRDQPRCDGCHRRQSFCLGCHERLGVVDIRTGVDGAFVPLGQKRFHPTGWSDAVALGQPNHHKWQAERNIKQCAACHRQETCLECHATNSVGLGGKMWVNPHPPDWRGSGRCQALADRNPRVCLRCHAPNDSRLNCH